MLARQLAHLAAHCMAALSLLLQPEAGYAAEVHAALAQPRQAPGRADEALAALSLPQLLAALAAGGALPAGTVVRAARLSC